MVGKLKCMVMFQYSICDMHFSIMNSELILGFCKFLAINDSSPARGQIRLFANKKKDLVLIELTFL